MHGEGVDLHAVDLVAGESAGQGIDADVLRLEVAGGFVELAIERGRLDLAALAGGTQRCIFSELAENLEAAGDQFLERNAVMGGDVIEADVNFFFVVLGAEIPGRAGLRQRAEPIFAGHMRNVFHHFDDAFAGAAFAGEQPGLVERDAISDRPLALRPRFVVPVRHVEPSKKRRGRFIDIFVAHRIWLRYLIFHFGVFGDPAFAHAADRAFFPAPIPTLAKLAGGGACRRQQNVDDFVDHWPRLSRAALTLKLRRMNTGIDGALVLHGGKPRLDVDRRLVAETIGDGEPWITAASVS